MLAAADLTYEAVSARMATILRAGVPIPKCWIICIATKDANGTPWSYILADPTTAKIETSTRMTPLSLRYEDIAAAGEDRVVVMIGVR